MPYIYDQEAARRGDEHWWTATYDDYDLYLQAGSAGELAAVMVLSRSASGASFSIIRHTTLVAASKRWTRFSPRSR